jgi:chromosome segregation protein
MYVRSLRLDGFKSFAVPTILEFEHGVNVIVGPNGSGKSNIADALSWVLGSQAPSSLRGSSMEDVIFAGSDDRPRLGIAEVALTLDNADRVLPLDLSEVTIARSTDRSGMSEYKINGAPCRLLDITELLSDTGIGRSIHTVVGQGQLDAILQARPEERRAFIEEAAQIGKFRRRKDRSVKKIERVDDNLLRLNDVLSELRRAIRPLKRQASAASVYSELLADHRELKQRLAATEVQRLAAAESTLDPEAEAHRGQLLAEELATVRARLEDAGSQREALANEAVRAQQTANGIGRASDRLDGLSRLASERAERISARLAAETEEGYRERIRLLEGERDRWSDSVTQLKSGAERARAAAEACRVAADREKSVLGSSELRLAETRGAETAAAQALVRAEGAEAATRATLGSIESRVQAAVERRELAANALEGDSRNVVRAEEEVKNLEKDLDQVTEAAAAAETRLESARENAERLREALGATHAATTAAQARVAAFDEVLHMFSDNEEVVGRLAPVVDHARQQSWVATSDEGDARRVVERAEAEVEARWREVASQDEELRRLDALVSGAAERLAGARRRREKRETELATLDEELSRSREALAAAERGAIEERAALPAHRAAVDEARGAREESERAVAGARERVARAIDAATAAELEARSAEDRSIAAALRVEEAEAGIADATKALEGIADTRTALESARDRAEAIAVVAASGAQRAARWAREAETRASQARDRAQEADSRLTAMRSRERELADGLEQVTRRRNEAEVKRAETRARSGAVGERAMEEWGLSLSDLMAIERFEEQEETEARERIEKLDRQMRRMGAVNPRAAEEYAELAERETFLVDQIEDLKASRRDLMKIVKEVDETIVEVFKQAFEDVAGEFEGVFERLFPGGRGRLYLTDPDNLLTSGIEVEARPPGKNVKKLSLLSGGERSLVALALLFSIFRSRPSPFYLLDEVEAALDDVNLQRFLGLVDELEERAQVLIVTHQKRTMEAADVLYGVSIAKDGVSRVVAKRMEEVAL